MNYLVYVGAFLGIVMHLLVKYRDSVTKKEVFQWRDHLLYAAMSMIFMFMVVIGWDQVKVLINAGEVLTPMLAFFIGYTSDSLIKNISKFNPVSIKKTVPFILLLLLPAISFSQPKFEKEEKFYAIDTNTNMTAYCAYCFDSLYTRWGAQNTMSVYRAYMDSTISFLMGEIDSSAITVYNEYGRAETTIKADLWAYAVGSKLMNSLQKYAISTRKTRYAIREDFIRFCKGDVYIRHFK